MVMEKMSTLTVIGDGADAPKKLGGIDGVRMLKSDPVNGIKSGEEGQRKERFGVNHCQNRRAAPWGPLSGHIDDRDIKILVVAAVASVLLEAS